MKVNIEYRELTKTDASAMSALIDAMPMYKVKKKPTYFKWHNFEAVSRVIVFGAFIDQKLIGMFGIHNRKTSDGKVFAHAKSMNVHPQWNRQGIFKKLGKLAFKSFGDADGWCVFANQSAVEPCNRALGLNLVTPIGMMIHDKPKIFADYSPPTEKVGKQTEFPSCFENKQEFTSFQADSSFRKWRYGHNPLYEYHKVEGPEECYAITKTFTEPESGICYGDLVDFECSPDKVEKLVKLASGHLYNMGVEKITTWALSHTHLYQVLQELDFKIGPPYTNFMARVFDSENTYLTKSSSWELRQADAENY